MIKKCKSLPKIIIRSANFSKKYRKAVNEDDEDTMSYPSLDDEKTVEEILDDLRTIERTPDAFKRDEEE